MTYTQPCYALTAGKQGDVDGSRIAGLVDHVRGLALSGRMPDAPIGHMVRTAIRSARDMVLRDSLRNCHFDRLDSYYRPRSSRLCTAGCTIRYRHAVNKIFTLTSYADWSTRRLTRSYYNKINKLTKLHKKDAGWPEGREPLGPRHFSDTLFTDLSTGNVDYH